MLAQIYLINTSNAVRDSVIAHFEHCHSCALLVNCKDLVMTICKRHKLSGTAMKSYLMKTRTFMVVAAIGLSLGACSNAASKGHTSVISGSLSQTNEATTTGGVNTNGSNISSFLDITFFDFDSADSSADICKILDKAVDKFLTNPSGCVVISGHADKRGTRECNLALGHLRASAVADYMVANGIDGLRIKKISFGKEKPLLKGSNEKAWSKNRRVEINGE